MRISFCVSEDENLGVEYLSSYLKKNGHEVSLVFNPKQFDKAYTRNEKLAKKFDWDEMNLEELRRQKPDIIGFSCVTATYQWALKFAQKVRKEFDVPIIFGGVHPTLKANLVIKNDAIDMVCVGEGEEAILELLNSMEKGENRTDIKNIWIKKGNRVIKNPPRRLEENLDKYVLDRQLFFDKLPSNYRKSAYFLTSRGCPFNCTYCGNEQKRKIYGGLGKYVRQKTVDAAIEELADLKAMGAKHVLFIDDVLTMNRVWFIEFAERYKEEIGLPFTCFIHAKMFDTELGKILKRAGCKLIWFGIQTGSEKVRKDILDRFETDQEIIRAAEACRENKLRFMVDHIFDIPADDNISESINLYAKIKPYMLNCYNLLYFPSSKIIEHAIKYNKISDHDIHKINRGKSLIYQTGSLKKDSDESRSNYSKYAFLLTLIPVLPRKFSEKIAKNEKAISFFGKFPLIFIPLVKVFLNFRVGHGFIPLAVLKTEIFWIRQYKKMKKISKQV